MTFWAAAAVVTAAAMVGIGLGLIVARRLLTTEKPLPAPADWGRIPDDRKWEAEAQESHHSALKEVRESAKAWAASISALLGVGGTVAFVKGPDTFAKLSEGSGNVAFWLTVVAAVLAGGAIAMASFAAQGTPRRYASLDGWTLKKISRERAEFATKLLVGSRVLTVVAAVCILVGFGIVWHSGIGEESEVDAAPDRAAAALAIGVDTEGVIRCGRLGSSNSGALSLHVRKETFDLRGPNAVEFVNSCPPKK
jgi:hypothetical protein